MVGTTTQPDTSPTRSKFGDENNVIESLSPSPAADRFTVVGASVNTPFTVIGNALVEVTLIVPPLGHINVHLDEAIYIQKIAALCGMSTSRFHVAFRESVGMAPGKFVQDLRLRKAQALLATSDQPVKAVAAAVGYPDEFHFSRLFNARFGRSPSEYRRQAREHRM